MQTPVDSRKSNLPLFGPIEIATAAAIAACTVIAYLFPDKGAAFVVLVGAPLIACIYGLVRQSFLRTSVVGVAAQWTIAVGVIWTGELKSVDAPFFILIFPATTAALGAIGVLLSKWYSRSMKRAATPIEVPHPVASTETEHQTKEGSHEGGTARAIGLTACALALLGSLRGTYFYYTGRFSAIKTEGDRNVFVVIALLSGVFIVASRWRRWVAGLALPPLAFALFLLSSYPITKNISAFWGQALAAVAFVVALLASLATLRRRHTTKSYGEDLDDLEAAPLNGFVILKEVDGTAMCLKCRKVTAKNGMYFNKATDTYYHPGCAPVAEQPPERDK
ncbi:MAG: hypothetical protein JW951_06890 [Lentisphaerae bacterium]|nr:hypothetical protein [Lentisphaerota bacterium]